jgi:predicted esterase
LKPLALARVGGLPDSGALLTPSEPLLLIRLARIVSVIAALASAPCSLLSLACDGNAGNFVDGGPNPAADAATVLPDQAAADTVAEADVGSPPADLPSVAPDTTAAKQGTGGTGGKLGHTEQTISFGNEKRLFAVHTPTGYDFKTPVPLVLHFHGWRPLPAEVSDELLYVWAGTADANGFIAVAPEGLACPELNPSDPYACFRQDRDGPFVLALINHLGSLYNLDLDRLYLSGHSGGSFFIQGFGLLNTTTFAAAVEFSGGCISASDKYGNSCSVYTALSKAAPRKIPFAVVHHATDQVVPVKYSADLLALLKANAHPTKAVDKYTPPGTTGHSIDNKVVPDIWAWLSTHVLP